MIQHQHWTYRQLWASLVLVLGACGLAGNAFTRDSPGSISNETTSVGIDSRSGVFAIDSALIHATVLRARMAVRVNGQWVHITDYPNHRIRRSRFHDPFGEGSVLELSAAGLPSAPNLTYSIRLYDDRPLGEITARAHNSGASDLTLEAIRLIETTNEGGVELGPSTESTRVLSDSFSENRPVLQIYDLGAAPNGLHRAVGSQLLLNRTSGVSLFLGALSSDRFLTILRLRHPSARAVGGDVARSPLEVDCTGVTEIQTRDAFPDAPEGDDRVELRLALHPQQSIAAERLQFSVSRDYHEQLETYGRFIRDLHHARVSGPTLMGWWSWTAYYRELTEGSVLANAEWESQQLRSLGYDYFHVDSGYEYAPGEFHVANASRFPRGMRRVAYDIRGLGLKLNLWLAPFYVGSQSVIFQQHPDWLVHNRHGQPIRIMRRGIAQEGQDVYALDPTHPAAQEYLRSMFDTLVREWGVRYFKLDFMDSTTVEGVYHRPDTTALEAQRIGLEWIRHVVGDEVLLDKDASPMLNPVGIVDEGRISQDTAHTFVDTRAAAPAMAARYYMHRNFFVSDPDAFNVSRQVIGQRATAPMTLDEAEVSIALATVSGGMFEIGDDLPALGADPERLRLITNPDLLAMAKLGRAFTPIDLMTYESADELPSIFLLRQDERQWVVAIFNWTGGNRSHTLSMPSLGIRSDTLAIQDVLRPDRSVSHQPGSLIIREQEPHSVRIIKIIDTSRPPAPPDLDISAPTTAKAGILAPFTVRAKASGSPALGYHWSFGDGIGAEGAVVRHAYTHAGTFAVEMRAEGLDGLATQRSLQVIVEPFRVKDPPARYIESPQECPCPPP